jgi:hypothetical protein
MPDLSDPGKLLIVFGLVFVLVGVLLMLAGRVPWLGRLPGDLVIERDGFSCFVPIATMIVLSLLLTIVLNIVLHLFSR